MKAKYSQHTTLENRGINLGFLLSLSFALLLIVPGIISFFWYHSYVKDELTTSFQKEYRSKIELIKNEFEYEYDVRPEHLMMEVINFIAEDQQLTNLTVFNKNQQFLFSTQEAKSTDFIYYDNLSKSKNFRNSFLYEKVLLETSNNEYIGFFEISNEQLFEQVSSFRSILIFRTSMTTIFIILLLFVIISLILKPLNRLSYELIDISNNELSKKLDDNYRIRDFRNIANNINKLIDKVSNSQTNLINNLKETTRILQSQNEELKIAKSKAEESNNLKSEFVANVSHEIRTPMNAIIGFSDILKTKINDQDQRFYLDSIISSGKTLLALINDILDFSKIESGKLSIEYESVNLKKVFNDIVAIFGERAKAKQLNFISYYDVNLPEYIILDEFRLKQIITNLLSNAIKFTETGWIKFSMYLSQYNPITSSIDLQIIVEDSGIGIPENDKQKVFLPFVQQSGQITRKYGGTGLGLAITNQLIKMMNGEIVLESEINKGSKFNIELKKIVVSSVKESKLSVINSKYEFEPSNILLVDDIELNRTLLKELFTDSHLNFFEASDGFDAISKAKKLLPDLIVMDIKMPIMDGVDATTYLKKDLLTKHIPIIALTASAIRSEQEQYQKLGFDIVLIKPVEKQVIADAFRKYLKYKEIGFSYNVETNTDIQENIIIKSSDITIDKIQLDKDELIYFNNNIINRAMILRNTLIISEVKSFADEIRKFGEKNNISIMIDLSNKVLEYASRFQLQLLKQTLLEIEQLNQKLI